MNIGYVYKRVGGSQLLVYVSDDDGESRELFFRDKEHLRKFIVELKKILTMDDDKETQ